MTENLEQEDTRTEGEPALPPPPELPQLIVLPGGQLPPQKKVTLKDVAWRLVIALSALLALLSLGAWIAMTAWNNGVTPPTGLPDIDWTTAFSVLLLLRIVALTTKT